MRKTDSIIMLVCLLINTIFYLFDFYKSLFYDSFIFIEENPINVRIVLLNIVLSIAIVLLIYLQKTKLYINLSAFLLIWINNWFILGNEVFDAILYNNYIYVFKLLFAIFSSVCILFSLIMYILILRRHKTGDG